MSRLPLSTLAIFFTLLFALHLFIAGHKIKVGANQESSASEDINNDINENDPMKSDVPVKAACFSTSGKSYSIGATWVSSDCSKLCTCKSAGIINCGSDNCPGDLQCLRAATTEVGSCVCPNGFNQNGNRCHPVSPVIPSPFVKHGGTISEADIGFVEIIFTDATTKELNHEARTKRQSDVLPPPPTDLSKSTESTNFKDKNEEAEGSIAIEQLGGSIEATEAEEEQCGDGEVYKDDQERCVCKVGWVRYPGGYCGQMTCQCH